VLYFRPLAPTDYPLLLDWLARPHVKEWWDDGDDTLEKVALHYEEADGDEQVERFILMWTRADGAEAEPIGYFQWYLLSDGSAGIDQFIGEEHLLNHGIGTQAIRQFLAMLIARHEPRRFIIDPDPRNRRAIRCYEKAGFRYYETLTLEDGSQAYMMAIDRAASTDNTA
jgi:RimJ/RimL family protein N-acetyltransferase